MNITDVTYYQNGKKFIPNVNNLAVEIDGVPNSGNEITYFITKYERQLLIYFLGISLYNELQTALQDLPNAAQKWQDLVNGVDYTKDNVTYRFDGLKGNEKDSLLAYYVFCEYLKNDNDYYSTVGTTKSMAKDGVNVTSTRRYLEAWYEFINKYQNECGTDEPIYYVSNGVVVGIDYHANMDRKNKLVSLETYLKDHETEFEGYDFQRFNNKNTLGI